MEDLNQTQLVLLAILVSFVTSIGTGIITVSLLDEAPPKVTQTINRVVERTIETVSPSEGEGREIIRETVVIKEEDQVVDAIEKATPRLVRIKPYQPGVWAEDQETIGLGILVRSGGVILTDGARVSQAGRYSAVFDDGAQLVAKTIYDPSDSLAVLGPEFATTPLSRSPATLSGVGVKLGQTVIRVSGSENTQVKVGRVTNISSGDVTATSTASQTSGTDTVRIETDITSAATTGSVLLNLSGEVVGMYLSGDPLGVFVSASEMIQIVNDAESEGQVVAQTAVDSSRNLE